MRGELKSGFILIVTLVLVVLLGGVASAALRQHRTERVGELRRPGGFVEHMPAVIEPRDDARRARLHAISNAPDVVMMN